ncbi:hypothetical protein A2480_01840 [Candidatus Uhrbacteria bacterium RIFOXYC2_FULL_47_19]|uniref:Uncharacterized protein n=1 Tax=Candidatus Uhrbacteria bacterium RIFOXYC2_FULL_47_19 TaxID=1802424 RepID=A0A1F7WEK6_9BACT|nr:MAG: hypothetical protein A2480_01840 [Candidatus Uhrbacteria bacterium RIFOXYC2_FULL_47_19]HCC22213.1 hypothetical protein [Candidatus Uhrbacteria bacterium]
MAQREIHFIAEQEQTDDRSDFYSIKKEDFESTSGFFDHEIKNLVRKEFKEATESFGPGTVLPFGINEENNGLDKLPGLRNRLIGLSDTEAVGDVHRLREVAARIDIGLDGVEKSGE